MDPDVAWLNLIEALSFDDLDSAEEYAVALIEWLDRKGFPPSTIATQLPSNWNRYICYCVCHQVLAALSGRSLSG